MAGNAYFSSNIFTNIDRLNSLEGWIENICEQNNISNSCFGNILVATTEFYQLLLFLDPYSSPQVYSFNRQGAFVIGFEAFNSFLDAAALVQKDLSSVVQQSDMNFCEACIVNVKTCADIVHIDSKRDSIELFFYVNSINSYQAQLRQQFVGDYIEGVSATKIIN